MTGLPQMVEAMTRNGSPKPVFDFDPGRTYFRATLPAHPEFAAISAIQDAAYLRTVGNDEDAFRRVRDAWIANESSATLAAEMVRLYRDRGQLEEAEALFEGFRARGPQVAQANVANVLIEAFLASGREEDARRLLDGLPRIVTGQDAIDAAILARRLRDPQAAHRYFEQAGEEAWADVRALHEFAQTKMRLAQEARRKRRGSWRDVNRRLLVEARGLLERVVQMDAPTARRAWASRDLARTLDSLRSPASEVEAAFEAALALLPNERRFADELADFRQRQERRRSAGGGAGRRGR